MKAPIRLFQFAVALSLFHSLVTALPPAVQVRTTPSPPAPPATRIITGLVPTSTGAETSAATPTRTATDFSLPFSQPPNGVLELRSGPETPVTSPSTSTSIDPSSTITAFSFPSGISNAQEFQEKWYLTTFWSCITEDAQTHCGWHEPVLPGGDDSVGAAVPEARPRIVVAGAAAAGAVVAAMGWGGWGGWLF